MSGLVDNWGKAVHEAVKTIYAEASLGYHQPFLLISCGDEVFVHLISLGTDISPAQALDIQLQYAAQGKTLVHLWEDNWLKHPALILSRIKSLLGMNRRVHARVTKITEITAAEALTFFNNYHLQGFVKLKIYYGLVSGDELLALAGFSALRSMKSKGDNYYSAELVRYASKAGYTVTGGLSRLIKYFFKQHNPDDLMTYADRDWSLGKSYRALGFQLEAIQEPAALYVAQRNLKRYFPHRLPPGAISAFRDSASPDMDSYLAEHGFIKIFNTGNLKYILYKS